MQTPTNSQEAYSGTESSYEALFAHPDDTSSIDCLADPIREISDALYSVGPVIKGQGSERGAYVHFAGYRFPNILAPGRLCEGDVYAAVSWEANYKLYMDPGTSSSLFKESVEAFWGPALSPKDPPEHTKYRAVMQRGFTPKQIESYKDTVVRPVLIRRFQELRGKGHADLVREINVYYPYEILGQIIGFNPEDIEFVARCFGNIFKANTDLELAMRAGRELREYAGKLVRSRRESPRSDFVSAMLEAEVEGERLPDDQLVGLIVHFLSGGIDTTYKQTGLVVYSLLAHPEQLELLKSNRELIPGAIEETLRHEGIGAMVCRQAGEDIELCGTQIPKGAVVFTLHSIANRDPSRWENPHDYDITRPTQRHIAFSNGPHVCIGQHIARFMLGEYIQHFLDDLPNVRWDPECTEAPRVTGWHQRACKTLPVVWD